ncbi:hypothetical protein PanWU01x14_227150 [Parasponia andersonii]|uniref:Uncharacterized protein n=1 Tax=Parasponia andersonii TaxID=3476 RepID=A0A2P5BM85_PARAD|nr:hypothetical protein PanWU01x14_227150 [Parasponia andersonii]
MTLEYFHQFDYSFLGPYSYVAIIGNASSHITAMVVNPDTSWYPVSGEPSYSIYPNSCPGLGAINHSTHDVHNLMTSGPHIGVERIHMGAGYGLFI